MREVVIAVRGEGEAPLRSSPVANAADQAARINPRDPNEIAIFQPPVHGTPGSPVSGGTNVLSQHETATPGKTRLDVLVVGPDVADVRECEGDDLTRVGRIREDFLVARHRGVETHFPHGLSERAEAPSPEDRAIFQD